MRKYLIPTIVFALIFLGLWNIFSYLRKPIIVSTNENNLFTLDKNYYLDILDDVDHIVTFTSTKKFIIFEKDTNENLDAYTAVAKNGKYIVSLYMSKDQSCYIETGKVKCSFESPGSVIYYLYVKESVWSAFIEAEIGVFFFVFVIYIIICWLICDVYLEKKRNGHRVD
jgi:hypothetical protein